MGKKSKREKSDPLLRPIEAAICTDGLPKTEMTRRLAKLVLIAWRYRHLVPVELTACEFRACADALEKLQRGEIRVKGGPEDG